jgi:2-octaprenyl-6-methoxyphenol hydroxylase
LALPPSPIDILIIGAGPVGMTLHLALAAGGQKSLLLDRRPQQGTSKATRAPSPCRTAPASCSNRSQPGRRAPRRRSKPSTSRRRTAFGRTVIDRADYDLPALGYVVRYRDLAAALAARLSPDALLDAVDIVDIRHGDDHVTVSLRRAGVLHTLRAKVLVHAEGTPGDDPAVKVSDYDQHAVICEVTPAPGHGKRAWERFTPDGPLALLPLGDEYSVVFTLPPAKADAVLALDDDAFTRRAAGAVRPAHDLPPTPARAAVSRSRCACAKRS